MSLLAAKKRALWPHFRVLGQGVASVTRVWEIGVLSLGARGGILITADAKQLREMTASQTSGRIPWGLPVLVCPPRADFECNSVLLFSVIDTVVFTPKSSVLSLWGSQSEKAVEKIGLFFFFFCLILPFLFEQFRMRQNIWFGILKIILSSSITLFNLRGEATFLRLYPQAQKNRNPYLSVGKIFLSRHTASLFISKWQSEFSRPGYEREHPFNFWSPLAHGNSAGHSWNSRRFGGTWPSSGLASPLPSS